MGAELTCDAVVNGRKVRGKAKLETSTLEFRGPDVKLVLPFTSLKRVQAENGELHASSSSDRLTLMLGALAAKWAEKILHPPTRSQKLGIKSNWRVAVIGDVDEPFVADLEAAVSSVTRRRAGKNYDAIFLFANSRSNLKLMKSIGALLAPAGALWLIRPKGDPELTETAVMTAGKAAGLVDVKVVGFSATQSALKFVIPVSRRSSLS